MKRRFITIFVIGITLTAGAQEFTGDHKGSEENLVIQLPPPVFNSKISVENALLTRRSERVYLPDQIKIKDLSQILWAAQGVTQVIDSVPRVFIGEKWFGGVRTAPSAGALFPVELYVAAGSVENLDPGLFKYNSLNHTLVKLMDGDIREDVRKAALGQTAIKNGPACIIIAANFGRTAFKYKERAPQYVYIESGAVCQNIYLQCTSLGIGTVMIGAIREELMKSTLRMPDSETPVGVMPIGYKMPEKD